MAISTIGTSGLAANGVTVAKISATGTPSSSTYLRGDGTWSSPAGGVTSLNGQTGAITTSNVGDIGSYIFGAYNGYDLNASGGSLAVGTTVAGSTLVRQNTIGSQGIGASIYANGLFAYNGVSGTTTSLGLTGTWRILTFALASIGSYGQVTYPAVLAVRVS